MTFEQSYDTYMNNYVPNPWLDTQGPAQALAYYLRRTRGGRGKCCRAGPKARSRPYPHYERPPPESVRHPTR
jgi:hypothetical protein